MSHAKRRPKKGRRYGRDRGHKPQPTATGTLHIHEGGRARVVCQEGTFRVAHGGLHEAMNGDKVAVSLVPAKGGERQAIVRSVLERGTKTLLARYEEAGPLRALVPLDIRVSHDFFMVPEDRSDRKLGVHDGDIVRVRILEYPSRGVSGTATIERRIGSPAGLDMGMESVLASFDLPDEFPAPVLKEAEGLVPGVAEALAQDRYRKDLRDIPLVTIDPADAKDFDDAVFGKRTGQGFELLVAIADVTHYVRPGSSLDNEAQQRTCSVYLADRVIPMLPEAISNGVCSLVPHEDRLAMAVKMELTSKGEVVSVTPMKAAIRSCARFSYDEVECFLETGEELPCEAISREAVKESLTVLDEVARLRIKIREKRGALDFPSREAKVALDKDGTPTGVLIREKTRATSLVEEAMLLTNESVAKILSDREAPCAYRVHETPSEENLEALVPIFKELDLFGSSDEVLAFETGNPHAMQAVLARSEKTPSAYLVSTMLLRAQKRAIYLDHNEGHFALGTAAYCHFTSPIRRYPDDTVHRALKAYLEGKLPKLAEGAHALPQLCRDCSDKERVADAAAHASQDVKMAELFEGHVGEAFSGIVDGVERFGIFVVLDDMMAEGLVPIRSLGDEYFDYDEKRMTLTGEQSGKRYRLGQRVAVTVHDVDTMRGRIGFALAANQAPASRRAETGRNA